jgi:uncharacterized protein YceK
MNMQAKMTIGIIATTVWVAAIVGKHFWPDLETAQIIEGAQAALVGLGVFHIAGGGGDNMPGTPTAPAQAQSDPVVPPGQTGRAVPLLLLFLAIGVMVAMGGCAAVTQSLSAANASAVISARAANDLQAKVAVEQFCLMPVDTLGRNPGYVKAVQDLCWSGSSTTPSDAAAAMQLQSVKSLSAAPTK